MSDEIHNLSDLLNNAPSIAGNVDIDSQRLPIQESRLQALRYSSDTTDRKWLAKWTAVVVSIWLMAVIAILFLNHRYIFLEPSVLIALLGTTTLNVLGLSFIVLRGHFKSTGN